MTLDVTKPRTRLSNTVNLSLDHIRMKCSCFVSHPSFSPLPCPSYPCQGHGHRSCRVLKFVRPLSKTMVAHIRSGARSRIHKTTIYADIYQMSLCVFTGNFQDTDILTLLSESFRTRTLPSKPASTENPETMTDSNIAGRARMITNDSRSGTGRPSFLQNHCRACHQSPPKNSPERCLHSRGCSVVCSWKTLPIPCVAIPTFHCSTSTNFPSPRSLPLP